MTREGSDTQCWASEQSVDTPQAPVVGWPPSALKGQVSTEDPFHAAPWNGD